MSISNRRSSRGRDDDLFNIPTKAEPRDPNLNRKADEDNKKHAPVRMINNAWIEENPDNPRFEESERRQEAFRELVESIEEHGLLQPIGVRRDLKNSPPREWRYIVVYGSRRLSACKTAFMRGAAHLEHIPCILLDIDDPDEAYIEAVTENAARDDLTDSELRTAIRRVADLRTAWSHRDIAKRLGVSHTTVNTALGLRKARELDSLVDQGKITATAATEALRAPAAVKDAVVELVNRGERVRVEDVKALRQSSRVAEEGGKYFPPVPPPDTMRPSPFTLPTGIVDPEYRPQAAIPEAERTANDLGRKQEWFCDKHSGTRFSTPQLSYLRRTTERLVAFLAHYPEE